METDSFLQMQLVEPASNLPGPSKGKEHSQVSQLILCPHPYMVAPDLKNSVVAHSAPLERC